MTGGSFLAIPRVLFIIFLAVALRPIGVAASDVTIYTEDFPPYNFITENNTVEGTATDIVRKVMEEAGLDYDIRLMPWPRAYRAALEDKRTLIFSLARNQARENQFDWLAYLTRPEFYLFARQDDKRQITYEGIKKGRFTAICEYSNASCMILKEAGFPEAQLFKTGDGSISETAMVLYGRADLFLGDIHHHPHRLKILGLEEDVAKPVLRVRRGLRFYLAAGLQVDTTLRAQVKAAYARLLARGEVSED